MVDHFKGLESDPYALARIKKSCELLDMKEGMTVLDVGCYKQVARQFLPKKCKYIGFDEVDYCGDTVVIELDKLTKKMIPKTSRLLLLEVLEHLKLPRRTLSILSSRLTSSGIAVISLPNEATIFHRLRSLLGTPDKQAFGENGKHLHLPNLSQSRRFVSEHFAIQKIVPYVSLPLKLGILGKILYIILQPLSQICPSLFSRGFIFVCKKR